MEIEAIVNRLTEYGRHMENSGVFSVDQLKVFMEPLFAKIESEKNGHPPRVLVLFGGGVGDFVLLSPCLREIRRIYDNAAITLVVSPTAQCMAIACPYVDNVVSFEFIHAIGANSDLFYFECVEFLAENFAHPFDIAYNFTSFFPGSLLAYMSGARTRFLYLPAEDWPLFHHNVPYAVALALSTVPPPAKKLSPHTVDRYLAVLDNLLCYPVQNRELAVWYEKTDLEYAKNILHMVDGRKIVAIGLGGSGGGKKSWPVERYAELVKMILCHDDRLVFAILGGHDEVRSGEALVQAGPQDKMLNFVGKLTYPQTAALLSKCDFYIGNDTGAMHIAAAQHLPVLAVFAYPADLPESESAFTERYVPYHVPYVLLQPDNALPECKKHAGEPLSNMVGCLAHFPHCITQVTVMEMYQGYLALREIAAGRS